MLSQKLIWIKHNFFTCVKFCCISSIIENFKTSKEQRIKRLKSTHVDQTTYQCDNISTLYGPPNTIPTSVKSDWPGWKRTDFGEVAEMCKILSVVIYKMKMCSANLAIVKE